MASYSNSMFNIRLRIAVNMANIGRDQLAIKNLTLPPFNLDFDIDFISFNERSALLGNFSSCSF